MKCKERKGNEKNVKMVLAIICILVSIQVVDADQIFVNTNRYIVLDDPNTGTASTGFQNPTRNWGSSYWSGESTTIRAIAIVTDNNGTTKSGVPVTFRIRYPNNTQAGIATSNTNIDGIAYYSFDLNEKKNWGNWTIEAGITGATNTTPFVFNWWGCSSCHNSKSLSTTTHTPKSYYVKGYNFHNADLASQHNDAMSTGSCTQCHKSYDYKSDWHTGKVSCVGCHPNSTAQLRNPDIAGCYDTNGCHANKNFNLLEINTTGYVTGGNYRTKYSSVPNNATKSHTVTRNVECILCHSAGHNIKKPYNLAVSSNSNTENEQCWSCHTSRTTTHKSNTNCVGCHTQDAHNISTAGGGGPNCISCHNSGGSATHKVDTNAMALGEHANLNSGATASGVDPANKKCWGCHQTGGTQPASDSMGDRYTNPYKCYDCHNETKPYTNVNTALTVSEHFKSGTDIKAITSAIDNSSSCISCHNKTEMKAIYTETDGINTGYSLASHYGKNRSELRNGPGGSTDCGYCHQNTNTVFSDVMANADNHLMLNHSTGLGTPCNICHNTGKIHDSSLTKPLDSSDTYCKTCHIEKEEHKTLYCTECHANNTDGSKAGRYIHGIKYLQVDNTFSVNKGNFAGCEACHQDTIVDSSIGKIPPKIGYLHHSNNITNGTRWGNYWTVNTGACLYCHNYTMHNYTPLGRPLSWNPAYAIGTTIGTGTNCADCHHKGDSNYAGMSLTFTSPGLEIPPEITSGSWNGRSGYFNHSLSDYTDQTCKGCHYKGIGTTIGEMVHNTTEGSGGGDGGCIGCHTGQQGIYPGIDTASFTNHKDVNITDGVGNLTDYDCKSCHYDTSDMSNVLTKTCNDCHASGTGGSPIIENHRPINGVTVNITTNAYCSTCHNNSIAKYSYSANASTSHYGTVTNLVPTKDCLYCHKNSANGNLWGGAIDPWNSPTFPHSLSTTTKEECYSCHGDISAGTANFHNKTLMKPALSSVTCLDCHKLGINMSTTKIDSSISSVAVHKNKNCPDCHTGATVGNMNTYSITGNPPVACINCHLGLEHQLNAQDVKTTINCIDCHNNNGMFTVNSGTNGTGNATVHYLNDVTNTATTPYGHNALSDGLLIDTSNCLLCHNGQLTGNSTWGSPVNITTSTKRKHTETSNADCNNCHRSNTNINLADVDFHNAVLTAGAGGDNCLGCHAGVE